eukprot:3763467-Prorocentrum_lima.AAC.1
MIISMSTSFSYTEGLRHMATTHKHVEAVLEGEDPDCSVTCLFGWGWGSQQKYQRVGMLEVTTHLAKA